MAIQGPDLRVEVLELGFELLLPLQHAVQTGLGIGGGLSRLDYLLGLAEACLYIGNHGSPGVASEIDLLQGKQVGSACHNLERRIGGGCF